MAQAVARGCAAGLSRAVGGDQESWWWPGSTLDLQPTLSRYRSINAGRQSTLPALIAALGGTFTRASNASHFDANGILQTVASNVPRLDYNPSTLAARGYLREPARTNSFTNNSMVGAVAGTPGTAPTDWNIALSGTGITQQIIRTGTEDGITYIDIKFSGTGSGNASPQIRPSTATSIVAAVGQVWAASYYWRVVGGTTTGVVAASWSQIWQERDASGTALNTVSTVFSAPTSAALKTQRIIGVRTLTDAGTARLTNRIQWTFTDGVAVDITLRIGLPQLELVSSATATASSPIVTTSAAVARAADVLQFPTAGWYNSAAGTFYAEGVALTNNSGNGAAMRMMSANDGNSASNTRIMMGLSITGGVKRGQVINAGGTLSDSSGATYTPGVKTKMAIAYASGDYAFAADGVLVGTSSTAGALPTMINLDVAGDIAGLPYSDWHGWIERLTYNPSRDANATMVARTA